MSDCERRRCCCKCLHQIRLIICGCGKCPSTIGGYVCDGLSEDEHIGHYQGDRRHGECELFEPRPLRTVQIKDKGE